MNAMPTNLTENLPPGSVFFPGAYLFTAPTEIRAANTLAEVLPLLEWARAQSGAGHFLAGYLAYEAGPAFEPAFEAHAYTDMPLAWFAAYDTAYPAPEIPPCGPVAQLDWRPGISEEEYTHAFAEIRGRIAAGETYQVNYTFPLTAPAPPDPWGMFRALYTAQPVPHACYIHGGAWHVLSMSPELFFRKSGDALMTRPMKGTCPRAPYAAADAAARAALHASEKDRAENVMITDMLRNDMARVSAPGSVQVTGLFDVARYATVWQMTSTITSRTLADVPEILAALFPSGSVTGAPKIQTSKIIRALEPGPRGVYCGAIGWWAPDGRAEFNVAIRTMTVDTARGIACYHVGSGITWDAAPQAEFQECLDKAAIVLAPAPAFHLLETIRFEEDGYQLLEEHLDRLVESACYFGYRLDRAEAERRLAAFAPGPRARVRLLLGRDGALSLEAGPLPSVRHPWRVACAAVPVRRGDPFLYHKTTHRAVYDAARAARPDVDDVLLFNEDGELTESTIANICLEIDGRRYTPARASGLLAGTLRARLLAEGKLDEAVLTARDLERAQRVTLFNSVRGEFDVQLVD
jgi:para-aminobenzoate synthetase/4-amino-4-deoxychorismate lyase